MEYLDYLIYPIAGILCYLALGGLYTRHPVVIVASAVSLALNGYAIFQLVWWPIPASIASDFVFKFLFGDPGAQPSTSEEPAAGPIDMYLLGADPLIWGKRGSALARLGVQIFILGMADMQRNAEGHSYAEFVANYALLLERHDLSPAVPIPEFVAAIGEAAKERPEVANLMSEGAMSIKSYIVERDAGAVDDLARAVQYAEMNKPAFEALMGSG